MPGLPEANSAFHPTFRANSVSPRTRLQVEATVCPPTVNSPRMTLSCFEKLCSMAR